MNMQLKRLQITSQPPRGRFYLERMRLDFIEPLQLMQKHVSLVNSTLSYLNN